MAASIARARPVPLRARVAAHTARIRGDIVPAGAGAAAVVTVSASAYAR
jgi:hypothetical protein